MACPFPPPSSVWLGPAPRRRKTAKSRSAGCPVPWTSPPSLAALPEPVGLALGPARAPSRRPRLPGQEPVAVEDPRGGVDEAQVGGAGLTAQHLEGAPFLERVALHEDALGPLDEGPAVHHDLEVGVLLEAAHGDVDGAA